MMPKSDNSKLKTLVATVVRVGPSRPLVLRPFAPPKTSIIVFKKVGAASAKASPMIAPPTQLLARVIIVWFPPLIIYMRAPNIINITAIVITSPLRLVSTLFRNSEIFDTPMGLAKLAEPEPLLPPPPEVFPEPEPPLLLQAGKELQLEDEIVPPLLLQLSSLTLDGIAVQDLF